MPPDLPTNEDEMDWEFVGTTVNDNGRVYVIMSGVNTDKTEVS